MPDGWGDICESHFAAGTAEPGHTIYNSVDDCFRQNADKIGKVIAEEIPARVAQDKAYQNAQAHSDRQNAKLEHDKALNRVVLDLLSDHTELFKQFSDNPNFKRWLTDVVFDATYNPGAKPPAPPQSGTTR